MKIVLALGNPGVEYENTYHNAGMLALPAIVSALTGEDAAELDWKSHKRLFTYATTGQYVFVRSSLFMNESGKAALEALKKFKVPAEDLIVLHDETDIPVGDFKISYDRSSGGHKGAQSIIDQIKSQTFTRVRIGVRPKVERQRKKAGDFVLSKIKPADKKILEKVYKEAAAALESRLSIHE